MKKESKDNQQSGLNKYPGMAADVAYSDKQASAAEVRHDLKELNNNPENNDIDN